MLLRIPKRAQDGRWRWDLHSVAVPFSLLLILFVIAVVMLLRVIAWFQ